MKSAMTSASPADDGELRLGILDVKLLCGAQRERQLRFGATRVLCRRAAARPIAALRAMPLHRSSWGTVRCAQDCQSDCVFTPHSQPR